jgi:hypothetical protein
MPMTAVPPVAQNGAASLQSPVEAAPPTGGNGPSVMEQKLLDYMMRFQAEGLGKAQHLANPAALSGEALKALKGYFERSSAVADSAARKANVMSESGDGMLTNGNLPALSGGPARERLDAASRTSGGPAEKVEGLTDAELSRTVDALMEVMRYSMETSMITTATNNITKSAMSLTRGQ